MAQSKPVKHSNWLVDRAKNGYNAAAAIYNRHKTYLDGIASEVGEDISQDNGKGYR